MVRKVKKANVKTLGKWITAVLATNRPMPFRELAKAIPFPYKSIYTKALELRRQDLIRTDANGLWSLNRDFSTSKLKNAASEFTSTQVSADEKTTTSASDTTSEIPFEDLDPQDQLVQQLHNVGIGPVAEVLAQMFFNHDIYSVRDLYNVLCVAARGWVDRRQANFVMSWWAISRGLKYSTDEFFPDWRP